MMNTPSLRSALPGGALLLFSLAAFGGTLPVEPSRLAAAEPARVAWYDDFQAGWAASKRSGRPMLIYITSRHCLYCTKMKQQTLEHPAIAHRLASRFIAIRLNPRDHGRLLARIPLKMYPTTLVATPRGSVRGHREGFQSAAQLLQWLDQPEPRPTLADAR